MPEPLQPFGQQHCDCFTRAVQTAASLKELLDALQECGVDVAPLSQENDETAKIAAALKSRFFPQEV